MRVVLANSPLLRCPSLEAHLLRFLILTVVVENPCKPLLDLQGIMIVRAKLICIYIKRFSQKSLCLRILAELLQDSAESSLCILDNDDICLECIP